MPKWTPYISGERAVVVGGDYIYCYALTHEESVKFAAAHNADIDALTAERDELQRRLDAVVAKISEAVVSDDDCVCSMLCHSAITAIAEGRDNG